ncbi:hypothetical protein OZX69_02945 [Lactobacillus sp. ESL0731]|uniref:hypothetical protein n=1 Tax=unclassified Lactobacillus TaxID=2620435 RepID=UPI0023F7E17C|nr:MULTISPECIES: hypothetical protein [unclassified Lactobacillus]WEV51667.1 hypothetical protein OZX63_02945 [Lactobacillus sp. ESL0700]WEV62796.1 hypothetical protein OZX69_02945 [Lactobacillus sp. ESL0731]
MKQSEKKAIDVLEKAFTADILGEYIFDIQDYYADETDQLAEDNPAMEDYLNDIIPEFTEGYDNRKKKEWLEQLRKIIEKAKTFV